MRERIPGSGPAAYSVFHDVNGSGSILADDFSAVKQRFFSRLPPPAVVPQSMAPAALFGNRRVAADVLGQ